MTVAVWSTGAPLDGQNWWKSINWKTVGRHVRRLQVRIAKAVKERRWAKIKVLQWLPTHSFYAKLLAIKRVTSNKGKRTPGVDKEIWSTHFHKMQAVNGLHRGTYRPQPLRRIYIPKKNGRKRPLGIPTMKDRAMQALHKLALDPVAETTADPNSYGFKSYRRCADAISQCFISLAKSYSPRWILEGDIKACFDEISHQWMLDNIPMNKRTLRKWLKSGYVEGGKLLIKPARKNVKAFLGNIRETIRKHAAARADELIKVLNPKISGWANYHRHVVAYRIFGLVDNCIYRYIWQWMRRKHPGKRKSWLVDKYWSDGSRPWSFSAVIEDGNAKSARIELERAHNVRIKRM